MNATAKPSLRVERTQKTLRAQVQGAIRDAIFDGVLRLGQKIIERELSDSTGVSRTIVREALARLEEQGLVGRDATNGSIVAVISASEVKDIYELRAELEALAARLFTERATPGHLDGIARSIAQLGQAFDSGHGANIRAATTEFYDILLKGSGNPEIRRSLTAMIDRIYLLRSQSMADITRHADSLSEMRALATALLARDAQAAQEATYLHVAAAAKSAVRQLELLNQQGTAPNDRD